MTHKRFYKLHSKVTLDEINIIQQRYSMDEEQYTYILNKYTHKVYFTNRFVRICAVKIVGNYVIIVSSEYDCTAGITRTITIYVKRETK